MTRDEALDLLALHGADELDAAQAAAVESALRGEAALREELAVYRELEGYLGDALADAGDEAEALPTWLSAALQEPHGETPGDDMQAGLQTGALVQRRCPYCHDQMRDDVVLCSTCATPHHGACFADHEGCSMLGCESTRAVDMDNPDARRVCASCQGLSPAEAPFCAWCATPLGDQRARRRSSLAQRMPWRQYLSAASLLLAATLGMGVYFGDQQEELAQMLLLAGRQAELTRATEFARETLEELRLAQDVFARADLDHDPSTGWALDLETLRAAIAAMPVSERERYGYGAMSVWGTWPPRGWYRYSVEVVDGAPCLVAERRFDAPLLPRLVCYPQGRIAREE